MDKYHLPHIKISAYNSQANGVVERGHFIIREAIIKACEGNTNKWPDYVPHAFFADRVTIRRQTGYSPFYLLHGIQPVLPFDLIEASFLISGWKSNMPTSDLLALRIRQLEKKPEDIRQAALTLRKHRFASKEQFERRFKTRLTHDSYTPGTLVLVRNTAVEKSLNRKSKNRYNGPFEVVRRTQGGSYILKELDGAIGRQGIAAFRVIPYLSRKDSRLQDLAPSLDGIDSEVSGSEATTDEEEEA